MRQLSRLLSVFIALILMGLSVATVSGHAADEATPKAADVVSVEVVLNSDVETASPGDELKFQVTVLRIADGHTLTGAVTGPDAEVGTTTDDIAEFVLDDDNPIKTAEVSYTIGTGDLGAAVERITDLVWTYTLTTVVNDEDNTITHSVTSGTNDTATGSAEVSLIKRPGGDAEVVGVELDFSGTTAPDALDKGEKVTFKLVVTTGDTYSLPDLTEGESTNWKSLVIVRQLYDADGEKVGNAIPSAVFGIPSLETGSTSDVLESAPETHSLQTAEADEIADGGKLVFSYTLTVNEADIRKGATTLTAGPDLNKDGNTDDDKIADLKGDILTLELAAPEAEATPEPAVGMTEAATVTTLPNNAIEITRHDGGSNFSLGVGVLTADGTLNPHSNGYIRDSNLGQTYAVANRESDGAIVRVWISSASPHVGDIDWVAVLDFYNVPVDVVNAIPLDHTAPAPNQLVDAGGTWYAYTGGAWRHIPDIATFQSRGYYYCDLTTAAAGWADNIQLGQALPSVGGDEADEYPVCR